MDDSQIHRLMTQSGCGGTLTPAVRRFAQACAALGAEAEHEPDNVVFRALLLAAWDGDGTRTAGDMRAAAVMLFGSAAVEAALARIRA